METMEAYEAVAATVNKWLKTNCNDHKENKNGFDYLSWVYAWGEALKEDATADFNVVQDANGNDYWSDGKTARVYVDVTIHGCTKRMSLPVMDYRNRSILVDQITSCDVNKSIMRCMVKCLAKFGLGLYIYAGEDLPDGLSAAQPSARAGETKDASVAPKAQERALKDVPVPKVRKVNPKAQEAWKVYKELPAVAKLDKDARNKDWIHLLKEETGIESPADIDEAGWDKVIKRLELEKVL